MCSFVLGVPYACVPLRTQFLAVQSEIFHRTKKYVLSCRVVLVPQQYCTRYLSVEQVVPLAVLPAGEGPVVAVPAVDGPAVGGLGRGRSEVVVLHHLHG
jgi:hypothetical protein